MNAVAAAVLAAVAAQGNSWNWNLIFHLIITGGHYCGHHLPDIYRDPAYLAMRLNLHRTMTHVNNKTRENKSIILCCCNSNRVAVYSTTMWCNSIIIFVYVKLLNTRNRMQYALNELSLTYCILGFLAGFCHFIGHIFAHFKSP